jgi:adenylate cyclase
MSAGDVQTGAGKAAILVVDDQPESIQLLTAILTTGGYEVLSANGGASAIEMARAKRPALVVLDVDMPSMDGFEVCARLKLDPKTADIPVLMLTAMSDVRFRIKGLQLGADDYLTKPYNYRELLARVERRLRAKVAADEQRAAQVRIRRTFERYVAPEVVERMLQEPDQVKLGGTKQVVTVLFADLRHFAAAGEELAPEVLLEVLNQHLTEAARAILDHGGVINQFAGDQIMAIFNAPLPQTDHAWLAAQAGLAIGRNVAAYHARVSPARYLRFGVGIATGEVVVGNIGTPELFNFTCVGDRVNLAQRMSALAGEEEVYLHESTRRLLGDAMRVEAVGPLTVPGRTGTMTVYRVLGQREPEDDGEGGGPGR